jgi:hypothetical protein
MKYLATPFNKVGFLMNPSRTECEKASADLSEPTVIAMSILAAGYLKPKEAINYLQSLASPERRCCKRIERTSFL